MSCCSNCADDRGGVCVETAAKTAMQSAHMSGWLDDAVKAGLSLLGGSSNAKAPPCAVPAGCFKCQAKGQGAIAACFNQLWLQTIPPIESANAAGTLSDVAMLSTLNQIMTGITSDSLFTPQTDAYLINTKTGIQQRIDAAQQRINAANAAEIAARTAATAAAQVAATQPAPATNLIDTLLNDNILMYGGIAVVVFLLVRDK